MSPTERPSWSAMMISTRLGGIDLASVPEAAITRWRGDDRSRSAADRQGDQAHGDDRGGDDAGRRGEQRAHEDDGVGKAAAHRPEQLTDGIQQILGHAGSFEKSVPCR